MTQTERSALTSGALDYDTTIIGALELSEKKWVLAVQLPGVRRHTRHVLGASGEELATLVILTHEAGREGFWLARFLMRRGVEMLLRTLMAWLRDEPRVCSMVPIPDEADEEARRAHREREDLVRQRRSILNKVYALLATLGVKGYRGLRSDRREQLAGLRQPDGDPVPQLARIRIERLLDRLRQIKEVEVARDAVLKKPAPADEAERMIRSLVDMRAIGPELATLLVREAFSRPIANHRALGSYVGLVGTPFSSGGSEREQGIGKDGNRRVRAAMVELAWLWLRWQPDSTLSAWFRGRVGKAGGRIKKIMIVALARKLLIALWRYAKDGVIPEGAKMKMA